MHFRRAKRIFCFETSQAARSVPSSKVTIDRGLRHGEMKKVQLWEVDFVMSRGDIIKNEFDQKSDICIGRVTLGRHFEVKPIYIHISSYLPENALCLHNTDKQTDVV
jgi:hypothetical protein